MRERAPSEPHFIALRNRTVTADVHSDCSFVLRVTGHLVDAETSGEPSVETQNADVLVS